MECIDYIPCKKENESYCCRKKLAQIALIWQMHCAGTNPVHWKMSQPPIESIQRSHDWKFWEKEQIQVFFEWHSGMINGTTCTS